MDKDLAKKLIQALIACREKIDETEIISREIEDESLRIEFRRILGHASLELYSEAMGRIILQHPELDPYLRDKSRD